MRQRISNSSKGGAFDERVWHRIWLCSCFDPGGGTEEAGKTENVKEVLTNTDQLAQYLDRITVVYD